MLTYNTMRFGTDIFSFAAKQALLIAKTPLNPNNDYTHIKKFVIDYSQPTGTQIRFAFYKPDTYAGNPVKRMYRISTSPACFISLNPNGWSFEPDIEEILEYGHTPEELLAISDLDFTDGADIYPVIVLEGNEDAIPKVKLSAVFETRTYQLEDTNDVHLISHNEDRSLIKILDVPVPEVTITGGGDYSYHFSYLDADGNWVDVPSGKRKTLIGLCVQELHLIENYSVAAVNDTNLVERALLITQFSRDANAIVFGDSANLYSIIKNYYLPLKYCAVIVKHEELNGAQIKVFAKFDPSKYSVTKKAIGTGTGESQTITLPNSKFTDVDSLRIYADDVLLDGVDFVSSSNAVTFTAPEGAAITASYTYNLQIENWIELTADHTQHDFSDGLFTTRYYCNDVKQYGDKVQVSAIRLQFIRGTNDNVPRVHSFTAGWAV